MNEFEINEILDFINKGYNEQNSLRKTMVVEWIKTTL